MRYALAYVIAVLGSGCVQDASLHTCGNGIVCPEGLVCDDAHDACVAQAQVDACDGLAQDERCSSADVADGVCREGVCLSIACGNAYVDPGEVCDDGNTADYDGCRGDCLSDGLCGTGIVDPGETCDDGNYVSHDGCDSRCGAEAVKVFDFTQSYAPPMAAPAVAYDELRGVLVVITKVLMNGGARSTVIWDGNGWYVPPGPEPQPRDNAAIAYDSRRHQMLLFGGRDSVDFGDTWIWNGERWTQYFGEAPSARADHTLVYDGHRDRMILFGGQHDGVALDDVWEWLGDHWTRVDVAPGPTPRFDHGATYDPEREQMVVFGGMRNGETFDDTWLWNGSWTRAATGPAPRAGGALSFSPVLHASVSTGPGADVWLWNGSEWSVRDVGPERSQQAQYFDTRANSTMVIGGTNSNSLTRYRDEQGGWQGVLTALVMGSRDNATLVWDDRRATAVVFGQRASGGNETWELAGLTWRRVQSEFSTALRPPSSAEAAGCFDSERGVTLVYSSSSLYAWNGTEWTANGAAGPGARRFAAMAFDQSRGVALLSGGSSSEAWPLVPSAETWQWNGATWSRGADGPARIDHRLAYDSRRERVVMFGGTDANGIGSSDVWEWDGEWHLVPVTGPAPRPRREFAMGYDPVRGETIIVGGRTIDSYGLLYDAWAWNGTSWRQLEVGQLVSAGGSMTYVPTLGAMLGVDNYRVWRMRWESGTSVDEVCTSSSDIDGDGRIGCADPDCACE